MNNVLILCTETRFLFCYTCYRLQYLDLFFLFFFLHNIFLIYSKVHALFTNCVSGWVGASCHCGIAIRSRQSLFVFRTCEKISRKEVYRLKQPLTEIRTCVDSDLSVETSGNTYTVNCINKTPRITHTNAYIHFVT